MDSLFTYLPGGLVLEGKLEREVRFHEITGHVEKSWKETATSRVSTPARVTQQLLTACSMIGGRAFTAATARALCVADRQFLMLQLTSMQDTDVSWVHPACTGCSELFDIEVPSARLHVKAAGASFPEREIDLGNSTVRVRVPTGGDQESVADLDPRSAMRALLGACVLSVDSQKPRSEFFDNLGDHELATIEEAMDEMAPGISTQFQAACPVCGAAQIVDIDPYTLNETAPEELFEEVHYLAIHYHWSEAQILDLPRDRRRLYMHLINRSRALIT